MAKIKDPVNFSTAFAIKESDVISMGIIDVILNADTNLFIDPLLLEGSRHKELSQSAHTRYREYFEMIIKLLAVSKAKGDVAWRNAKRKFQFHEISWTCLGYGSSVRGSGFGPELIEATLTTAKEIVDLGITDVDLFMALALFEEGIGPDRISDMTTNIILLDLIAFNERVSKELSIPTFEYPVRGGKYRLPKNPRSHNEGPLLLVPKDIVRDLPIATDWSDISRVVNENKGLRDRINKDIGKVWATMSRKQKGRLKASALQSKKSFESVLEMLRQPKRIPYNTTADMQGELFWGRLLSRISDEHPMDFSKYKNAALDRDTVYEIVGEIIEQFRFLVEERDLWRELWDDKLENNRREKAVQRLFFAIAYSYCKSNDLDLTPEAETGNGPVDFKVSSGFSGKVLVEIKLSTNPQLLHGYEKQLEIYRRAELTDAAYYLVINIGHMGKKKGRLEDLRNSQIRNGHGVSKIVFIEGRPRKSASKRA